MKEISSLKNKQTVMYDEQGKKLTTNNLKDELIWGMNTASELATVYSIHMGV